MTPQGRAPLGVSNSASSRTDTGPRVRRMPEGITGGLIDAGTRSTSVSSGKRTTRRREGPSRNDQSRRVSEWRSWPTRRSHLLQTRPEDSRSGGGRWDRTRRSTSSERSPVRSGASSGGGGSSRFLGLRRASVWILKAPCLRGLQRNKTLGQPGSVVFLSSGGGAGRRLGIFLRTGSGTPQRGPKCVSASLPPPSSGGRYRFRRRLRRPLPLATFHCNPSLSPFSRGDGPHLVHDISYLLKTPYIKCSFRTAPREI